MSPARSFQGLILTLQRFWAEQGCVILQPYDMEIGRRHLPPGDDAAGARAEALARRLRPALAPAQGRPLRREPQPAPALLPVPGHPEAEPAGPAGPLSRVARGDRHRHRSSTTSASSRTIGRARRSAPGASAGNAGATAWRCRQFTYFQQVAGFECAPVAGELTYGLERLAMYLQGVETIYDLNFNGARGRPQGHLRRRLPAGRAGILAPQFRARRHRDAVPPLPRRRGRVPRASSTAGEPKPANDDAT